VLKRLSFWIRRLPVKSDSAIKCGRLTEKFRSSGKNNLKNDMEIKKRTIREEVAGGVAEVFKGVGLLALWGLVIIIILEIVK